MTWHSVAALLIAGALVVACGHSPSCSASLPQVIQLATGIVGGVFGLAVASREKNSGSTEGGK